MEVEALLRLTRLYFAVFPGLTPFGSECQEVPPFIVIRPKRCLLSSLYCLWLSWQRSDLVVVVTDGWRADGHLAPH